MVGADSVPGDPGREMGSGGRRVVRRRAGVAPDERLDGGEAARGLGDLLATDGIPKPIDGPATVLVIRAARGVSASPPAETPRPKRRMTPSNCRLAQSAEDWWMIAPVNSAAIGRADSDAGVMLRCALRIDAATPVLPASEGAAKIAKEVSETAGAAVASVSPRVLLSVSCEELLPRSRTTKWRGVRLGPTQGIRLPSTTLTGLTIESGTTRLTGRVGGGDGGLAITLKPVGPVGETTRLRHDSRRLAGVHRSASALVPSPSRTVGPLMPAGSIKPMRPMSFAKLVLPMEPLGSRMPPLP